MAAAAELLVGTHDFAAFQASGGDQRGTVRTIYRCAIEERIRDGSQKTTGTDNGIEGHDIVIEGDGFLYKMVRIIAGTLVTVGMELAPPETVRMALGIGTQGEASDVPKTELRRRGLVGPTLPPEPLCLERVEYDCEHPSVSQRQSSSG